jgi:hypothetical protein
MDFFNFILTPKNNQGSQDIPAHIDDKRLTRMQKRRRNKPDLDKEQRLKKKKKIEEMKIEIEALKDELERLGKITDILFYIVSTITSLFLDPPKRKIRWLGGSPTHSCFLKKVIIL